MNSPLQKAIEVVGSQTKLARHLSVKQQNVWYWLNEAAGKVPAEYCVSIESATNGTVTRHHLRPDVFGPPPSSDSGQVAA